MNKTAQRLLIFFIGVPILVGIVFLLPYYKHLVFNLLVIVFSALGAVEFSVLLAQKQSSTSKAEAAILGILPPLTMYLIIIFNLNDIWMFIMVTAVVSWLLISNIFSRGAILDSFANRLSSGFAILLYPGLLIAWLVRMGQWEKGSSAIILTFLVMAFITDGAGWVAGSLFGKGNKGVVPVSPNKSAAGFIGGVVFSIGIGLGAVLLFPESFPNPKCNALAAGAILGLLTGIAAVLGDLGESAIKRSAGMKDSGNLILGRGGVLDSIDSVALAAPVYYFAFCYLFVLP